MHQLEIQFFYPLTEQIPLDLDYSDCEAPKVWKFAPSVTELTVANIQPNTFEFRPDPKCVGYWEVSNGVHVWREQRPSWLHQHMTRVFFGWKWNDK